MPTQFKIKRWIPTIALVISGLVAGIAVGAFLPQDGVRGALVEWLSQPPQDEPHQFGEDDVSVFDVTQSAQESLKLETGVLAASTFTSVVRVPAFVREKPAVSNLRAASRIQGSVSKIFVSVGQSVREGDPLLQLDLTGDELATAQSTLLDSIKQLEIIDADMPRLERAAASGGPSVKTLRERKFERKRVEALIKVKREELLIRGLSEQQVKTITDDGTLIRSTVIRVPTGIRPRSNSEALPQREHPVEQVTALVEDDWVYSIESMLVSPGAIVNEGQPLCDLAYHETLLLEGQAYERDVPLLTKLIDERGRVVAELGDDNRPIVVDDLQILFMDNHVDNESQTYRFYLEVANDVLTENTESPDRRYRTWRFKPGQRGHIGLPSATFVDKIVVPAAAVAKDGIDDVMFRWQGDHNPWHTGEAPHSEFERVVVKVLYRDRQQVVIETGGDLQVGDKVALNNGYMLLLALQQSAGESGGHSHHDHDH